MSEFPQVPRLGGELARATVGGAGFARELGLCCAALGDEAGDLGALRFQRFVCGGERDLFFGNGDFKLTRLGNGSSGCAFCARETWRSSARKNASAHGACFDAPLSEGGGDDCGLKRALRIAAACGVGVDLRMQRIEARLRFSGGSFCFLTTLVGGVQARIELAHFAARGVSFRAQAFGARGLSATFALGLRGRTSGLGVRVP